MLLNIAIIEINLFTHIADSVRKGLSCVSGLAIYERGDMFYYLGLSFLVIFR